MGTNYYLTFPLCEHCGRSPERVHIGKSSAGWCFSLHIYPERGINTLEDWKKIWTSLGTLIEDEYETPITVQEMESEITERSWPRGISDSFDYKHNGASPGPNGLLRHIIKPEWGNVGHGEGTWDYCVGDFS